MLALAVLGAMAGSDVVGAESGAVPGLLSYDSGPLDWSVPDDTDAGLAGVLEVPATGVVGSLQVSLTLSVPVGSVGWAGDLYVHLEHAGVRSVLMNRVGRTESRPYGNDDSVTFDLTFRDDAVQGDIHAYRSVLGGSPEALVVGTVSGQWAPSGRGTDPGLVTALDARSLVLSQFSGSSVAGGWTLFVADLSGGGEYRLDRWGLTFETTGVEAIVPEPGDVGAWTAAALLAGGILRRCGRSRGAGWVRGAVGGPGAGVDKKITSLEEPR